MQPWLSLARGQPGRLGPRLHLQPGLGSSEAGRGSEDEASLLPQIRNANEAQTYRSVLTEVWMLEQVANRRER